MNPEAKKIFLEYLRAGYAQCTRDFRKGDAYCAIGLLRKAYVDVTGNHYSGCYVWSQLNDHWREIVVMNDAGNTFEEIAQFVESNL